MFKNYLTIAVRNILKNKVFSFINVFGLATGMASFIIILLYLNYELSYDKWNDSLKRVSRVSMKQDQDISDHTPIPLASFLAKNYADAQAATSIQSSGDFEVLMSAGDRSVYQKDIVTVDSSFLKVFPYQLTHGDVATALNAPDAIILSEELAHKLFGNENPVGKPIKIYSTLTASVTGVLKTPAGPAHLTIQALWRDPHEKENMFWENYSNQTYIRTKKQLTDLALEDGINRIFYNERLKKNNKSFEDYKKSGYSTSLFIDQVGKIHNFPKHGSSNFTTVSVLLILAILLLLAGAINFSNLSVAQSIGRAKEVGMRKVMGSGIKQLVVQFMGETGLQCLISLGVAILMVSMALPYLNRSFDLSLSFLEQTNRLSITLQLLVCLIFIILLSGIYPALFLSRFNTAKVLKGDYSRGKGGMFFRNGLIIAQFIVSSFFIMGIIVIRMQMTYMHEKDKGFTGDQVMRIQAKQGTRDKNFESTKAMLLAVPGVQSVSKTTLVPGDKWVDTGTSKFKYSGSDYRMKSVKVSTDYFKTLNIALLKGRSFSEEYTDQHTKTAIINESASQLLKLDNPIGITIHFPHCDTVPVQVIGVIKDFNVRGLEQKVLPEVYTIGNNACMFQSGGALLVKLNSRRAQQSVASIVKTWKNIEPDFPIQYSFLNDNFQKLFISYQRLEMIISFFAVVAVLISIMGLFALTAFLAKQRTKEIGIRKVLGASVGNLATLLSRDFIKLVMVSVIVSTPIAWWAMREWLQTFAYRISLSWWMFGLAAVAAILIAVATVSVQAIKAALANPVKNLRTE